MYVTVALSPLASFPVTVKTLSTTPETTSVEVVAGASRRPHRRGSTLTTFRELGILPETAEALEAVG
ncbi:hypothetical protein ABT116_50415, partial [Streptomyces sp. NPDC002130]|uniref:hypothetical protein n=1 Tax=Streptomyces sp. NPDC002130 TaxID=3155568 RepID=UPI0033296089